MKMITKSTSIQLESGSIIRHIQFQSTILRDSSRAGFSSARPHAIYIPAGTHDHDNLPQVYMLAAWMGAGRSMFNWEPFREDLASRLDRLIKDKIIPPCIVVCPDLFIDFGGSQYINSTWIGNHGDHIVEELIPWVESHLPVARGTAHRCILGRSSGGFGALRFVMDYHNVFAAAACHAGDMGFEWVYRRSLIDICTALSKQRDPAIWMQELTKQKKISGFDTHALMMFGMCAFYSPNPDSPLGFDIPVTIRNGEIIESTWQKWLGHDPLIRLDNSEVTDRLGHLKALYLDCGNKDQYFLQYGARQFSAKAAKLGINHTYGEFDDNHSGTAYRFDESLPKLLKAIV
jgi:S-formylglutathione hydrolase FrmB